MWRKRISSLLALLSILLLSACSRTGQTEESDASLRIVTSFYPIYSLVKEVSGEINDVRMIGSRNGIHSYEPSAADIKAIYDADVFIYHSHVLESWAGRLEPNLKGSTVQVLEASTDLPLIKVAGLEDVEEVEGMDPASLYDPHTWLDPVLVGEEAIKIGELLGEVDPSHKEQYEKNAQEIQKKADDLADHYTALFKQASHRTFVTQHTAFSYTANRFGLKQLGIAGVSEEEPSPRRLAEIKEFVDTYQVKSIFTEKGASDKLAMTLASSTGVELKVLDPLEADPENNATYLENLEAVLEKLAQELK